MNEDKDKQFVSFLFFGSLKLNLVMQKGIRICTQNYQMTKKQNLEIETGWKSCLLFQERRQVGGGKTVLYQNQKISKHPFPCSTLCTYVHRKKMCTVNSYAMLVKPPSCTFATLLQPSGVTLISGGGRRLNDYIFFGGGGIFFVVGWGWSREGERDGNIGVRRMRETLRRVVLTLLSCCCRLQRGLEGRSAEEVGCSPCGGHGGDAARDRGGGGGGHHHAVGAGVLLKTWEWIAVCVM